MERVGEKWEKCVLLLWAALEPVKDRWGRVLKIAQANINPSEKLWDRLFMRERLHNMN